VHAQKYEPESLAVADDNQPVDRWCPRTHTPTTSLTLTDDDRSIDGLHSNETAYRRSIGVAELV